LAKEGASGIWIGDLNLAAAAETIAECQTVATHPQFQGKAVLVDVTKEDSVRNLFREAVSEFGRVDYCVNCAGVSRPDSEAEMCIAGVVRSTC
jgi:NAD(P)-dependent dehydrogenase (short-subunit alcohol dehydrogenase family)